MRARRQLRGGLRQTGVSAVAEEVTRQGTAAAQFASASGREAAAEKAQRQSRALAMAEEARRQGTALAVPKRPEASGVSTPEASAMFGQSAYETALNRNTFRACGVLCFLALLLAGCGYHVAGRDSKLPSGWKEISIPAFKNDTAQYRIEQIFTQAVIREFISRTKYRVVQDDRSADAVVRGEILSIETTPLLFDANTGEVRTMLVTVHARVSLTDNQSQKIIYENKDMVFRQQYQISGDVRGFFLEESPALERMSREFAAQLVSGVLENF